MRGFGSRNCRILTNGPHEWSDYSPLSSTSSDVWMGDLQRDPFLVSVHLIADPGEGGVLQRAADSVLARLHPELQLFRVSERAAAFCERPRPKHHHGYQGGAPQPALAVILFLREGNGGGQELAHPPWRYHHSEVVSGGRRLGAPTTQDFFTLGSGTPLWALRRVRYGKGTLRLTLYCCHDNYAHTVRLYKLLLGRRLAHKKHDFCFLVVYANPHLEVQMAFRRLPRGRHPTPLDSSAVEVRVRDVGALVPLLPNACRPISDVRWQTQDYDGNKILLQVQAAHRRRCHHHPPHRTAPRRKVLHHQASLRSLPLCGEDDSYPEWFHPSEGQGRGVRSESLYSLPNLSSSPGPPSRSLQQKASLVPPFRLNVDALVGTEETDVDTGTTVRAGGVDLRVVSAYVHQAGPPASHSKHLHPEGKTAPPERARDRNFSMTSINGDDHEVLLDGHAEEDVEEFYI
ncbi:protein FAM124A isoform X1 [Hippocampus zosterae]|uniref:protein FAM124A isoform X1 n=1 Tax=Hippocampus zosterae TaxID=109293 RepID=UPI00223E7471|nr:protein FAM124A isoform X1 [Hippocampus zosterae]